MRKLVSAFLALMLIGIFCLPTAGASITEPNSVAALPGNFVIPYGFTEADIPTVRLLILEEYNRGIQTRSVLHRGTELFDYGRSTDDLLHSWTGASRMTEKGEIISPSCINQDFVGGYSDSLAVLGYDEGNWCCILVTPESLKKGEAYTVRDGIANAWENGSAASSFWSWGLPTGNQYWIGNICYQTFEYGYAAAEDGQVVNVEFFRYDAGYTAPEVPGPAAYDYDFGNALSVPKEPEYIGTEVLPPTGTVFETAPVSPAATYDPAGFTAEADPPKPDTAVAAEQSPDPAADAAVDAAEVDEAAAVRTGGSAAPGQTTVTVVDHTGRILLWAGAAVLACAAVGAAACILYKKRKKAKAADGAPAPEDDMDRSEEDATDETTDTM